MSTFAIALAGITPEQLTLLSGSGILNDVDLGTLSQSDFDEILPSATIVTRRRLYSIGQYATSGETLTGATTIVDILTKINNKSTSPTTSVTAPLAAYTPDPSRGAPKMYVDGLADFGGVPIKWEDWSIGTGAALGQMVYSSLLSTPPLEGNVLENTRNRELYFMFKKALYQGAAYHIVERTSSTESGHQVWQDLHEWFGSAEVSRTVIDHYRNKLNSLKLTHTSEANDYINDYILCSAKLEAKSEGYTAETKLTKFLDGIEDDDYDVAVQNLRSDKTKTFQDAVLRIRTREQELLKSQWDSASKARRATSTGSGKSSSSQNKSSTVSEKQIPSIPDWILRSIKPDNVRRYLIRWRGVWNSEERHLQADERTVAGDKTTPNKNGKSRRQQSDDNSVGSGNTRHSDKGSNKKQKTKKSRRTKTSKAGLSSTPQVYLKDEDDINDDDTSGSEDDSDSKPRPTKSTKKKSGKTGAKKKRIRYNPVVRRGCANDEAPRVVLDEGTEFEVIGGAGWVVLEEFSKQANMGGWRAGMDGPTLPIVNAVCAFDDESSGKTVLLGVGSAAWDDRAEQRH